MDRPEPNAPGELEDPAVSESCTFLRPLDELLSAAVAYARRADPAAAADRWRGMHLEGATVAVLTQRGGLLGGFAADTSELIGAARRDPAIALLARLYALPDIAVAVLLLAAAPEIDARYGRIFGFLQDDITRRLPSPALAIDLFCGGNAAARDRVLPAFSESGMLTAQNLLQIETAANETLLTATLRLDPQIRQLVLGESGIDPRLIHICSLRYATLSIGQLRAAPEIVQSLLRAASSLRGAMTPLRLVLLGPADCGQAEAASALANAAEMPMLTLDARALITVPDPRKLLTIIRREALLANALVRIDHAEALEGEPHAALRALLEDEFGRLAPGVVLLAAPGGWAAAAADHAGMAPLVFALPPSTLRRRLWEDAASAQALALAPPELDVLATRFRLTPRQIAQAAARAAMALRCQPPEGQGSALAACFAAAPAQGGHHLTRLAKRITPRFTWSDLVTTAAVETQLREICARVRFSATVLENWNFAARLSLGRGISALFAGPSGTGKTMAAEVIAGALGLDMFKIDLAAVVSKYIGETEQNLDRIFRAAEDANGILLFDEADALFGKRSEVQDSHDRYANLEISYLLQKMEEFEGVAILSTNLQKNLDDAFTRRLSFIVHFPFPEAAERQRIWETVWPDALPRDPDLSFSAVAQTCKLSGGNIKSAAIGAAYYAAAEGDIVSIRHVVRAVQREYEKLGRPLKPEETALLLQGGP